MATTITVNLFCVHPERPRPGNVLASRSISGLSARRREQALRFNDRPLTQPLLNALATWVRSWDEREAPSLLREFGPHAGKKDVRLMVSVS